MKKITIKNMIENSNMSEKLIRATIAQFGGFESFKENAEDITRYGISGGFHGFICYTDTVSFFRKNKKDIMVYLKDMASDFGQGMFEMIQCFNCMKGFSQEEIAEAIYESDSEYEDQILNCLSWTIGEEVSRLYCDILEQED